jgi:phosphomannomutase
MIHKSINIDTLMASSGVLFGTSGARALVTSMRYVMPYCMALFQKVVCKNAVSGTVVLGHDLRPSSPQISSACVEAIRISGGQVYYARGIAHAHHSYARQPNLVYKVC